MTRNGQAIEAHPLRDTVDAGIEFEPLLPGLVPLYEEREAAAAAGYRWADWQSLTVEERAAAVAFVRLRRLVALHQGDAMNQAIERRSRQQQAQRG